MIAQRARHVGRARRRVEDQPLLTGGSGFVADLVERSSHVLHVAFARSPFAHASIRQIERTAASQATGVVRVVTGRDVAQLTPLPPPGPPFLPGFARAPDYHVLPAERARFVGQPVAAIVASSAAAAHDALDLLEIDYDPLPAVADVEAAIRPDAPLVHADYPSNVLARREHIGGKPDAAFAAADRIVQLRLRHARVAAVAMEPRGVLAQWDAGTSRLTVWLSTQAPFLARADLARVLGLAEDALRVIAPDVGGGFGAKGLIHPEELLVAHLARQLDRPLAWIATRSEDMQTTLQGRDMLTDVEAAVMADGRILALRLKTLSNVGAYAVWQGPLPGMRLINYPTGCYAIEHLQTEVQNVFTNSAPTGPYRGAGRPEAAFVAERVIDEVAAQLGLDPIAVRRSNFIPPAAFPYQNAGGVSYDSGNYAVTLDRALELADYARLRREQAHRRARGELVGIGLATFTEVAGAGFEGGQVSIEADGTVTAHTGSSAHGQGHRTTFAQIVADELGVSPALVNVRAGDTDAPIQGTGTFGSRSVVLGGNALRAAAEVIRQRALRVGAALLEVAVQDLELSERGCAVRGAPDRGVPLQELARAAERGVGLSAAEPHALRETTRFSSTSGDTFPFGAIVAAVSIAAESGQVRLEQLVLVDDCGTVINPLLVDGQLAGGAAQGIAEALREAMVFDDHGQLMTASLMDYAVPRATDIPRLDLDRTETPSPRNPLGAKGVGESATVGTPAAIANAVVDALRPLGITNLELPMTSEQVWRRISHAP